MRTRRPISTISYNSDKFIASVLTDWVNDRKISWWCFMKHLPDTDATKEHKHVFIMPDTVIDTVDLSFALEELVPDNPIPLKCMPFQFSKWDDWYLYALHDKYYLKYKGMERNYHYHKDDMITSNEDFYNVKVYSVDISPYSGYNDLVNAFFRGESFADLVIHGHIPLQRISQFATVWKSLERDKTPHIVIMDNIKNKEVI